VSETAQPQAQATSALPNGDWRVRPARHDDVGAVVDAVCRLLVELGGTPASVTAMETTTRVLLDGPWTGAVLVAEAEDAIVGVLSASWQIAIHVPGRYALIQDLWVDPAWRSRAVGGGLLAALFELARARQVERVEVGLPRESFASIDATEAFYRGNGFTPLGPRMRLVLT
jgi:GNAT superfamily N-acetyltransferase